MTAEQIKQLTQPIVNVYEQLTDELMLNIASQLKKHGEITETARWQMEKLAEIGELNNKNIKTIAKLTGDLPVITDGSLGSAALGAIEEIEPALRAAARAGIFGETSEVDASDSINNLLQLYQKHAVDNYNLVNTVMQYKARDAYTGIVNKTADLLNRSEYTAILGKNTVGVSAGIMTRQQALRQCIKEFAEKGLPGFVDRAGREWTPEAYINMDIRTTVNNVAREAVFARNEDYGNDLVWVPINATARDLCYPWQGKIISMSNRTGIVEDLFGNKITIIPVSSTSYGKPAGLWGINCHHGPNVFIPGITRIRGEVPDKKINDKRYNQSQKQRLLERKVRESKRECAMLDKMGDKEGFTAASQTLKQRELSLKDYTQKTRRTYRSDRVQVNGYSKSVSAKTTSVSKNLSYIQNDATIKSTSGLPKRLDLPDEKIKATVNVDLPKLHGVVPKGARTTNVYCMAGSGTSTPIRDLKRLYMSYPEAGSPAGWRKKSGDVINGDIKYVVHWYENNGFVPPAEIKLKGVKINES